MAANQHSRNCISGNWATRFAAVVALCSLVFLQLFPLAASAAGNGEWIEICSDSGVVLVKVDLSGETEDSNSHGKCPDCAQCPFCALSGFEAVLAIQPAANHDSLKLGGTFVASQRVMFNAAQFWPDNRGPPLAGKKTRQKRTFDSAKASLYRNGDAPCT